MESNYEKEMNKRNEKIPYEKEMNKRNEKIPYEKEMNKRNEKIPDPQNCFGGQLLISTLKLFWEGGEGGCFLFLLFWGTPKDMDLRNAYV